MTDDDLSISHGTRASGRRPFIHRNDSPGSLRDETRGIPMIKHSYSTWNYTILSENKFRFGYFLESSEKLRKRGRRGSTTNRRNSIAANSIQACPRWRFVLPRRLGWRLPQRPQGRGSNRRTSKLISWELAQSAAGYYPIKHMLSIRARQHSVSRRSRSAAFSH